MGALLLLPSSVAIVTLHAFAAPEASRSETCFFLEQARLEELQRLWELLLQKTREKGLRLLQAQKLLQYLRECDDALDWISDKVR